VQFLLCSSPRQKINNRLLSPCSSTLRSFHALNKTIFKNLFLPTLSTTP